MKKAGREGVSSRPACSRGRRPEGRSHRFPAGMRFCVASALQVQELHVALVLVQDVADDLFAGVADQIVFLA